MIRENPDGSLAISWSGGFIWRLDEDPSLIQNGGVTVSIFTTVLSKLASVVRTSNSVLDVAAGVLGQVATVSDQFKAMGDQDPDVKRTAIMEVWEQFDLATGVDGIHLISTIPPEVEESLLDHVKEIGIIFSSWAAGLYGSIPSADEMDRVRAYLDGARGLNLTNRPMDDAAKPREDLDPDEVPEVDEDIDLDDPVMMAKLLEVDPDRYHHLLQTAGKDRARQAAEVWMRSVAQIRSGKSKSGTNLSQSDRLHLCEVALCNLDVLIGWNLTKLSRVGADQT